MKKPKNPALNKTAAPAETLEATLQNIEAPKRDTRERAPLNHAVARETEIGGMKFRRTRSNLDHSAKMTLDISKDVLNPDLEYRWVNDDKGRIQRLEERGYAVVDKSSVNGLDTTRRVGNKKDGSPLYATLMATPKEWYKENQAAAEADRRSKEEGLITGKTDGKESLGGEFYMNKAAKLQS